MIKLTQNNIMQTSADGKITRQIRATREDQIHPVQEVSYDTVLPGGEIPYHVAECDEVYLVLKGDMACNDNGTEDVLHVNDSLICKKGDSCGLKNTSEEAVEMMRFVFYH